MSFLGSFSEVRPGGPSESVREYFCEFLTPFLNLSFLPYLKGTDIRVGFVVRGESSEIVYGLTIQDGILLGIVEGEIAECRVEYVLSASTFIAIVSGNLGPEMAFMQGKVQIKRSLIQGLKLAILLQGFFRDHPYLGRVESEVPHEPTRDTDTYRGSPGVIEEILEIQSDHSSVDCRLTYSESGDPVAGCVIAPAHPFLGATADNHLLRVLADCLAVSGQLVMRFNYTFPHDSESELEEHLSRFWSTHETERGLGRRDLETAWTACVGKLSGRGQRRASLVGYSYGAFVSLDSLLILEPSRLVLLSPVASMLEGDWSQFRIPTLLIASPDDFATSADEWLQILPRLPQPVQTLFVEGTDHFFRGKEPQVAECVRGFLVEPE